MSARLRPAQPRKTRRASRRTAHNHVLRIIAPKCKSAQRPFGSIVGQTDSSIAKETRKVVPALEHVIDWLSNRCRARQAGSLLAQPHLQSSHKGRAVPLPDAQTFVGGKPVDAALDIEQRVDAPDRLQRYRRDRGRAFAAPGVRGNLGKLEELPPRMCLTQCGGDRPRRA